MDLRFTDAENAFRAEVRAFIKAELDPSVHARLVKGEKLEKHEIVAWSRTLNRKGWAVTHWPLEWGGCGWTPIRQMIFHDELQMFPAPEPLAFGTSMVGPVIYTFGNEAQKRRFLPRIANLDDWWCQGFSEPGAGSDLASLKTTARRDGEHWILSGQKTWTTLAHYADWIFVLARTDMAAKKQMGISFILVDMKSPGITVRPLQTIDGGYEINEVFFDDVRVPLDNLVGEENKGWDYAKFLLTNERNGQARVGVAKARLQRIRELATAPLLGEEPLMCNARFRLRLAELEVEATALEMTQFRVIAQEERLAPGAVNPASSILKIKGSELQQATTELLMDVIGPFALPYGEIGTPEPGSNQPIGDLEMAQGAAASYFNTRKMSIYGGSNEIQRSIIAKAILGL